MATTKTKIGNLFFNFRGDWKSTETYIKDDVVMYNNSDYICVKNTDSTNDVPKENKRRYVRLTKNLYLQVQVQTLTNGTVKQLGKVEEQVMIGDTLILSHDGNDFDDNKPAFADNASNKGF